MFSMEKKFKNALYRIREQRGLTQKDIAEAVGTTANQISRLESGVRKLSPEWIDRLSLVLNCSKAELLGEEAPERLTEDEQKLLDDFRQLSPEKKENMRLILTALLSAKK